MTALVSIIIPTYNRAHLIGETLDSILAQTYTNWECIVVDDGSTDGTDLLMADYIKKDSRFQYHLRPSDRPKGANACRNFGFETSKGEFVNWFDSDDLMHPYLLEKQILGFQTDINLDFVICGYRVLDNFKVIKKVKTRKVKNYVAAYLFDEISMNTANILWKWQFAKSSKWDESISKYQDLLFILQLLSGCDYLGFSIEQPLIDIRVHRNSITSSKNVGSVKSKIKVRRIIYKIFKRPSPLYDRTFHLYLVELRNAINQRFYRTSLRELLINSDIAFRYKLRLLSFMILHSITGKGSGYITNYLLEDQGA